MKFAHFTSQHFKVGLSAFKKNCPIYFDERPLKMMANAFGFTLKDIFVLKLFKFLFQLFRHGEKAA